MDSADSGGWAGRAAGPRLCADLARADAHYVSDERLPALLGAQSRHLAFQQAQLWTVMAELAVRDPMPNLPGRARWTAQEIFESAVDEIRAELRMTRRAARTELANAVAVAALPEVMQALTEGVIDRARALVFADACAPLSDVQAAALVAELLPGAAAITATWLAEKAQQVAIGLDPDWAEHRYRQAVTDQRVIGYLNPDGSAVVTGQNLPAEHAAAACARVDALADTAKRAGATAGIDHLRATLFLGLLDGRFHGLTEHAITTELLRQFPTPATQPERGATGRHQDQLADTAAGTSTTPEAREAAAKQPPAPDTTRRGVHLRVGLSTLLGLDELPGALAGWGVVQASVARTIAADQHRCEWRFAILDDAGQLLFDGITRYRPTIADPDDGPAAETTEPAPGTTERLAGTFGRPAGKGARVRGGIVELHVPITLLTDPGLAARHPQWAGVLADLAAQHAQQQPIEQDPAARFAGRRLRRHAQTRFQRCIFPSCRRPATDCDLDHHRDHARGGKTEDANLGPGCKHDHLLKTSGGWRLVRRDEETYLWISPLGRKHVAEIDPIAPPVPAPVPAEKPPPPDRDLRDELPDPTPTFQPLDRRGRPIPRKPNPPPTRTESALDPPPF